LRQAEEDLRFWVELEILVSKYCVQSGVAELAPAVRVDSTASIKIIAKIKIRYNSTFNGYFKASWHAIKDHRYSSPNPSFLAWGCHLVLRNGKMVQVWIR
jgi:hypothetical protein